VHLAQIFFRRKSMAVLQNKHILLVTSVYPESPTGHHGAFIRETVLQCQSTGAKFTVFAPAYEGSQGEVMEGVQIYRFRYCLKQFENLVRDGAPTKLQRQPWYLVVAFFYISLGALQLFWVCLRERPDILHIHWPFPHGLMALPASKLLKIPMVFSFHGAELMLSKKFPLVATMLRSLTPMAQQVTANSSFTRDLISKIYPGPVSVIPYGLTVTAKPASARLPHQPPILLFVGRLDERKGLRYLLDALPLVLAKRPVELRIVGAGLLESELKQQCCELGLESTTSFLGFVSKQALADEYAHCDVFVLPAIIDSKGDTEGLGVVLIEALAHGKPVVASAVGGIKDVISPRTGWLVPEKDEIALAEAINSILANPVQAAAKAQLGLQDVQERFCWSRIVSLWQHVFENCEKGLPLLGHHHSFFQ
jgi:glycosyltransferase involved in cell wall biosynthesis